MAGFSVYRFYDAEGVLLYVGRSARLPQRIRAHLKHKAWWSEASRIDLEHFDTEAEMIAREALLIRSERPVYNIVGQARVQPENVVPLPRREFEPYHNLKDAAERYGVTEVDMRRWQRQGMPITRIGSLVRVRYSQVDAWLAEPARANSR